MQFHSTPPTPTRRPPHSGADEQLHFPPELDPPPPEPMVPEPTDHGPPPHVIIH